MEYLNDCVTYPLGIFIDKELYERVEDLILDLGYNIWPLPSSRTLLFEKATSLLYSMPWTNKTASVEILAENPDDYNEFMEAARNQHLCLMYFRTRDNIYLVIGNKLIANFKENGTIFVIPTGRTDKSFIAGNVLVPIALSCPRAWNIMDLFVDQLLLVEMIEVIYF